MNSPSSAAFQFLSFVSQAGIQATQASIASERLGEAAGAAQITQFKGEQLRLQIEAVRYAIAEEEKLRKTQLETNLRSLESQYDAASKSGNEKGKKDLASQIATTKAALSLSGDRVTELKNQAAKLESDITTNQAEAEKQRRAERLKNFDERQAQLQSDYDRRLVSEEEFNRRSLELTRGKTTEELKQLEDRRKKLLSTPQGRADKEGLEAIAAEEAKVRGELAKAEEKSAVERFQMQQRH